MSNVPPGGDPAERFGVGFDPIKPTVGDAVDPGDVAPPDPTVDPPPADPVDPETPVDPVDPEDPAYPEEPPTDEPPVDGMLPEQVHEMVEAICDLFGGDDGGYGDDPNGWVETHLPPGATPVDVARCMPEVAQRMGGDFEGNLTRYNSTCAVQEVSCTTTVVNEISYCYNTCYDGCHYLPCPPGGGVHDIHSIDVTIDIDVMFEPTHPPGWDDPHYEPTTTTEDPYAPDDGGPPPTDDGYPPTDGEEDEEDDLYPDDPTPPPTGGDTNGEPTTADVGNILYGDYTTGGASEPGGAPDDADGDGEDGSLLLPYVEVDLGEDPTPVETLFEAEPVAEPTAAPEADDVPEA